MIRTLSHGDIPGGMKSGDASVKSLIRFGDIAILTPDLWDSIEAFAQEPAMFGPINNRGYPIDYYEQLERRYTDDYLKAVGRAFNSLPQDPYLRIIAPVIQGVSQEISNPIPTVEEELDLEGRMINIPIQLDVKDPSKVRVERYVLPAFEFAYFCYDASPGLIDDVMFLKTEIVSPNLKDLKKAIRRSRNPAFRDFNEFYKDEWKSWYGE